MAEVKATKKVTATNQRANIHYSGDLRLLPALKPK